MVAKGGVCVRQAQKLLPTKDAVTRDAPDKHKQEDYASNTGEDKDVATKDAPILLRVEVCAYQTWGKEGSPDLQSRRMHYVLHEAWSKSYSQKMQPRRMYQSSS